MRVPRALSAAATLLASLTIAASASAASAPARAPSLVVSRLRLDARSPQALPHTPPVSTPRLRKGRLYVATVQGTISYYAAIDYLDIQKPFTAFCGRPLSAPMFPSAGGVGEVGNDAQFIFAQPIEAGSCGAVTLPRVWLNFQVNEGDGWAHPALLSPRPITAPLASHTYSYAIVGQNRPLRFELDDPDTFDDYGSLEILVRRAVRSDCAGGQWRAFGHVRTRASCDGSTAHARGVIPPTPRVAPLTVPQAPIVHVVRDGDLPTAHNLQVPSGALGAAEFAPYDVGASAGARWARTLTAAGYRSAAISEFDGIADPTVRSTAILARTAAGARTVLADEIAWATSVAAVPSGDRASTEAIPGGTLITFRAAATGAVAGAEAVTVAGSEVVSVRELAAPGAAVTVAQVEGLQALVASR